MAYLFFIVSLIFLGLALYDIKKNSVEEPVPVTVSDLRETNGNLKLLRDRIEKLEARPLPADPQPWFETITSDIAEQTARLDEQAKQVEALQTHCAKLGKSVSRQPRSVYLHLGPPLDGGMIPLEIHEGSKSPRPPLGKGAKALIPTGPAAPDKDMRGQGKRGGP